MAKGKEKPEYKEERWLFMGRRMLVGNKIGYLFLADDGEHAYQKIKAHIVGGIYEVRVHRKDNIVSLSGVPIFVEQSEDERIPEWRLLDKAAEAERVQHQRETKARREGADFGDVKLRDLKRMMRGPQAAGVLAVVLRYLNAA